MKILIVDDARAIRKIVGDMLREMGFEVMEACDGVDALKQLHESELPDACMIDWNMPNMNGIELIKAIRAQEKFRDLPLMMVTSETEMDSVSTAFLAGANEYVMKPFSSMDIVDKFQILGIGAQIA